MIKAPIPDNEVQRLESVKAMQLLSTPEEEAFDRITRVAKQVFDVPIVTITVLDENRQWFKSQIGMNVKETPRDISFCGHTVYADEMMIVEDASTDPRFSDSPLVCSGPKVNFYAGRPLRNAEGFAVGALCLMDKEPRIMNAEDVAMLNDFGYWVESVFATRHLSKAVEELLQELNEVRRESMMDSLLSIWNRGAVMDILAREADQAQRQKEKISIMMVDIDQFKSINDTYGHHIGDQALINVVKVLRQGLRSYDSVGRYGGEEFLIVLPNTSQEAAGRLAERLRSAVGETLIEVEGHQLNCTVSIGVSMADLSLVYQDMAQTVIDADMAMLKAKAGGRNRVEIAVPD
jgi:diguanylate cyclase (GGDEF)-like protein